VRLLDLVLDGIFFVLYIMGPESVVQLCTVMEMSCLCLEYVDVNKCTLQFPAVRSGEWASQFKGPLLRPIQNSWKVPFKNIFKLQVRACSIWLRESSVLIGRDFLAVLEGETLITFAHSKLKIVYLMLVFCKPVC
jgi:hypothetical protein